MKIQFSKGTAPLIYTDTLHFSDEEYAALTSADIEAMKEDRYARWYAIITAPPEVTDG